MLRSDLDCFVALPWGAYTDANGSACVSPRYPRATPVLPSYIDADSSACVLCLASCLCYLPPCAVYMRSCPFAYHGYSGLSLLLSLGNLYF